MALYLGFKLAAGWEHVPGKTSGRFDADDLILFFFIIIAGLGFRPTMLGTWIHAARHAISSAAAACVVVTVLAVAFRAPMQLPVEHMLAGLALGGSMMLASHAAAGRMALKAFAGQPLCEALIVDEAIVDHAASTLRLVHADHLAFTPNAANPLLLDRLARALRGADVVYVACPPERRRDWAAMLRGSEIPARFLIPEFGSVGLGADNGLTSMAQLSITTRALSTRDQIVKRALDLLFVIPALLFFAPLFCIIAALIKLDTPGPVLFVQQRVGRGNLFFAMYKFRSMDDAARDDHGDESAVRGDRRVTRVGRFLRRTSLDELPQLFNVLKGDMSFVGPRPHALGSLAGDQPFWKVDHRYCDRHSYKPGLTGLAQVRGLRGATHRREDLVDRLQADLEYIESWSVWRDLSILLATVKVVLHKNAY